MSSLHGDIPMMWDDLLEINECVVTLTTVNLWQLGQTN